MSGQWSDPHGYWGGPAGQGGNPGYPPPGYGDSAWASNPYPYGPPPAAPRGSSIIALILAILMSVSCCVSSVVGIVFAAMAMGEKFDPERSERLTRYAWISNIVHFCVIGLFIVFIAVMIFLDETGQL